MLGGALTLFSLLPLCLSSMAAQGMSWVQGHPTRSPEARYDHALAYDAARQQVLLFGGRIGTSPHFVADTWTWDGHNWTQHKPAVSPSGRAGHSMVYDAARKQVVLFGGIAASSPSRLADTWLWDGKSWALQKLTSAPSPRFSHAMAYDEARQKVLLFGGSISSSASASDTWTWNGSTWAKQSPTGAPVARHDHAMAYDAARKQVLVFGGYAGTLSYLLADTWTWDGKTWSVQKPRSAPSARSSLAMAYHAARGEVVLCGGYEDTAPYRASDTWTWNGTDWTLQKPRGPAPLRSNHAITYDAASKMIVLFGGAALSGFVADTWMWGPYAQAHTSSYGRPCGSASGLRLSPANGSLPWIGGPFSLQILGLPASTSAGLMTVGFSRTHFGSIKLPIDLSSIGMKGCSIYNSFDLQFIFAVKSGVGSLQLAVPTMPSLVGTKAFAQAFGTDRMATQLGIIASNGIELTFGDR